MSLIQVAPDIWLPDRALKFVDGSSDRVEVGNIQTDPTVFTIIAQVMFTATTSNRRLCEKASATVGMFVNTGGGAFNLSIPYSTTNASSNTASPLCRPNVWYNFAGTFDGVTAPREFVGEHGQPIREATYTAAVAPSGLRVTDLGGVLKIGNGNFANNNRALPGKIAAFVWVNRVLLPAEIDFYIKTYGPSTGTLGRWFLGDNGVPAGATQLDLSGNGNNGTVTGATLESGPAQAYGLVGGV